MHASRQSEPQCYLSGDRVGVKALEALDRFVIVIRTDRFGRQRYQGEMHVTIFQVTF